MDIRVVYRSRIGIVHVTRGGGIPSCCIATARTRTPAPSASLWVLPRRRSAVMVTIIIDASDGARSFDTPTGRCRPGGDTHTRVSRLLHSSSGRVIDAAAWELWWWLWWLWLWLWWWWWWW